MSELSETSSYTSCSSDLYNISDDNNLSMDTNEMKLEELRLKQKHSKEDRAILRKLKEEELTKERKEKALKSMNYLLNTSRQYSHYFLDKFKTYSVEDEIR